MQKRAFILVAIAVAGIAILFVVVSSESREKEIERHLKAWNRSERKASRIASGQGSWLETKFEKHFAPRFGFSLVDKAEKSAQQHRDALDRLEYLATETFLSPWRVRSESDWDHFVSAAQSLTNRVTFFSFAHSVPFVDGGSYFPCEASITLPKVLMPQLRKLIEEWNSPLPATNSATQ